MVDDGFAYAWTIDIGELKQSEEVREGVGAAGPLSSAVDECPAWRELACESFEGRVENVGLRLSVRRSGGGREGDVAIGDGGTGPVGHCSEAVGVSWEPTKLRGSPRRRERGIAATSALYG